MNDECPFCNLPESRIWHQNEVGLAIWDSYPLTEGHTLVIPKQHVDSLFDLSPNEQQAVWQLVSQVRSKLATDLNPDGFNVGVNDGIAAGQTVMHAHIHVVPRRDGDVGDPRGGVRWVIPDKADYWSNR